MSDAKAIAKLNDTLRTTLKQDSANKIYITEGVNALPQDVKDLAFEALINFDDFSPDNDPYKEHDFGAIEVNVENKGHHAALYWKIDYYDKSMEFGSEDPANPFVTTRVLTLMLKSEY